MQDTPEEFAMVTFSMEELNELRRILRGHCRSLVNKEARGDNVPAHKIELANTMLHTVSETLLEIETYDIIGESLRDGTLEETVIGWKNSIGD